MSNLPPQGNEKKNRFVQGLTAVLRRIAHNGGWKLLSLLLAVCIWGVLVTQDEDLPRTKRFNDLKVNIINSRTLQENGLIVVDGLDKIKTVDIVAQLPQKHYATATADRYQIRADLSQVKDTGRQELTLTATVTNSNFYGSVISISPATITVDVESLISRSRIPVNLKVTGTPPEGFWSTTPTVDPYYVQVAGPKSVVEKISQCEVEYDLAMLSAQSGTLRNSLPFIFKDKEGNVLDDSHLTVSNQGISMSHVLVEQKLYPAMQVPVNTAKESLLSGQPADGYTITDIRVEPAFVTIADDDLTPYLSPDYAIAVVQRIDVTGENKTKTVNIALNNRGLTHISSPTVSVTIEIKPLSEVE